MMIGASSDDNLFQIPELEAHLDQMREVGANYIRNTMSERPVNGYEVRAFSRSGERYDLERWNPEYWERFEGLLEGCLERDIIVQVELWATHDFFPGDQWDLSPWNPGNNINYDYSNTSLSRQVPPRANGFHPFFNTVPGVLNDTTVLSFQKQFVDKVLSYTLSRPNVLYCITNEIQHAQSKLWGWFWADYIHSAAAEKGVNACVTEMYWATDLKDHQHRFSYASPDRFDYFESSQNSAKIGQENWDNLQYIRDRLMEDPRPVNAVKIYGKSGEVTWPGSDEEAVDRFWRNILGGCASSRFHRNEQGKYGLGWSELSVHSIRAMRRFLEDLDPWISRPATEELLEREANEAYMMRTREGTRGLYFTGGGAVFLDLSESPGSYELTWIDVTSGEALAPETVEVNTLLTLSPPSAQGKWACTLVPLSPGN